MDRATEHWMKLIQMASPSAARVQQLIEGWTMEKSMEYPEFAGFSDAVSDFAGAVVELESKAFALEKSIRESQKGK